MLLDRDSLGVYNGEKTWEGHRMNALTVGIIGGADGPTAIFVTGGPTVWETLLLAAVGVAVIAGVVFFVRKHRKKK